MTRRYIGTKIVTAWREVKGGAEGYAVKYEDGYTSWSPKEVFEASYRALEREGQMLTFGDAIHMLKLGAKVARYGWNGKGMFVYLVPANAYEPTTQAARDYYRGELVPYNAYLAIKNVNDSISTWVPSVNDCLAEDWLVLPVLPTLK